MMRDCQVVSRMEGSSEVMSGRASESSRQYHDVAMNDSRPPCAAPGSPQMAAVACASVPARYTPSASASHAVSNRCQIHSSASSSHAVSSKC